MDSDDDDYKRRDKFRSERRGGGFDGGGRNSPTAPPPPPPPMRREWREPRPGPHGGYGRDRERGPNYGDGGGFRGRERFSPPPPPLPPLPAPQRRMSPPPNKRMRGNPEWDNRRHEPVFSRDDFDRGGGGVLQFRGRGAGGFGGVAGGGGGGGGGGHPDDNVQPPMMSFKTFLATQDDTITDDDAIQKYAEYKLEFKRQQLNEFFVNHKEEEWFKLKYHPEDSSRRKQELKEALSKRIEVFEEFTKKKVFEGCSIDTENSERLLKVLDSVTIFLEGGNENDLRVLEDESASEKKEGEKAEERKPVESKEKEEVSVEQLELQKKAKEYLKAKVDSDEQEKKGKKRKRSKELDDDNSSGSEDEDQEVEEDLAPPGKEKKKGDIVRAEIKQEEEEEEEKPKVKVKTEEEDMGEKEEEEEEGEEDTKPPPRELHRTSSLFLRNLAPTIKKHEVEAMCRRYAGFMRASISDPQPDRRWFRRGWVTFERQVKIKDVCFQLNNIRLRECELGAIVNRDLTRRIRPANGLTVDRRVVRNDIKLAARVITNLDRRWGLWQKEAAMEDTPKITVTEENGGDMTKDDLPETIVLKEEPPIGFGSSNPVLDNITDYLIEEASAEEEELLGKHSDLEEGEEGEEGLRISRDDDLILVLDKMVFYLRVVHSVDFYSHSEYPNEHEMPNRCGILHARDAVPTTRVTQTELDDYCKTFERKMGSFLLPRADLTQAEASKLGMKNEEDEVEKFVQANTQELGKDKWLCPLSGKKFKAPDFVRKHIFNKHSEKIDEVKKEVQYYNSYLRDPKRPMLPENPSNKMAGVGAGSSGGVQPQELQGGRREMGRGPPPPPPPNHMMMHEQPRGHQDPYQYSGFPREATNYPVFHDRRGSRDRERERERDRGYNEPRFGGPQDHYDRFQGRRGDPYGGRGGDGRRLQDRVGFLTNLGGWFDGGFGGGNGGRGRPVITYRDLDAPRDGEDYY